METAKVDWWESGVGECIQGKQAEHEAEAGDGAEYALGKGAHRLLLRNVKDTADKGVIKSCTVEIESTLVKARKRICLVDGGVWTGCDVSPFHVS